MISTIASPYDQNPARLALIMKSNRRKLHAKRKPATVGALFGLAVIFACIWWVVPL